MCTGTRRFIPLIIHLLKPKPACLVFSRGHTSKYLSENIMASEKVKNFTVKGLIAPPATFFKANGDVDLDSIPDYVRHLVDFNVPNAFVTGTTGEGNNMTVSERKQVGEAWVKAAKGRLSSVILHIGAGNLRDSQELARHAESIGADAISCVGPTYHKPENLEQYVFYMRDVAAVAPNTPFILYDIDFFTGIPYTAAQFFSLACDHIPTLRGVKHTSADLVSMANILSSHGCRNYQVLMGTDEFYLEGLALGLEITIGNSFMGHVHTRMKAAFDRNDLTAARLEQKRGIQLHNLRRKHSFPVPSFVKAVLRAIGMKAGDPRCPYAPVSDETVQQLRDELTEIGYFDWGMTA